MSVLDFCIVGAPKCGTTALATYLAEHPGVNFSVLKEPYYYADDLPSIRSRLGIETRENYVSQFRSRQGIKGEGSTLYLFSQTAIKRLVDENPKVRIILMLRNPCEVVRSFYQQMLKYEFEDAPSLAIAWQRQHNRREGIDLPVRCVEPALLQYGAIASFGSQLERLFSHVDQSRVLVRFHSQMKRDVGGLYQDVLRFLCLPDCGRTEFPRINVAASPRSRTVGRIMRHPSVSKLRQSVKSLMPPRLASRIGKLQSRILFRALPPSTVDKDLDSEMRAYFADDISLAEQLLGCDLSDWREH